MQRLQIEGRSGGVALTEAQVSCLPLWHWLGWEPDDSVRVRADGTGRRPRRFRSVAEKRQIVELTLVPNANSASA